jgi:hypothetical protein
LEEGVASFGRGCSGENLYSGIKYAVTAEEIDGNPAISDLWTIVINVRPVISGANSDGFASWNLGISTTEAALEAPGSMGISYISVSAFTLKGADGSEDVVNYTFDLSNHAKIQDRLDDLLATTNANLGQLVGGFISGNCTYNSAAGTIAMDKSKATQSAALFLDSDKAFSIPVTALVAE